MAEAESALLALLRADSAIAIATGNRIYCKSFPGTTRQYPSILISHISNVEWYHTDTDRFQISVHSTAADTTSSISKLVRQCLSRYSGVIAGVSIVNIRYVTFAERFDQEKGVYSKHQDFKVTYEREVI